MEKDKGHLINIEKVEINNITHNHIDLAEILSLLNIIKSQNHKIIMTQAELAQALNDASTQADKAKAEILQKIADLEAAVNNAGNVTPEVEAAFTALKSKVQGIDDIVPDTTG